jgi:hypothetical protein
MPRCRCRFDRAAQAIRAAVSAATKLPGKTGQAAAIAVGEYLKLKFPSNRDSMNLTVLALNYDGTIA